MRHGIAGPKMIADYFLSGAHNGSKERIEGKSVAPPSASEAKYLTDGLLPPPLPHLSPHLFEKKMVRVRIAD
jgi:hypothetical protein